MQVRLNSPRMGLGDRMGEFLQKRAVANLKFPYVIKFTFTLESSWRCSTYLDYTITDAWV